MVYRVYVEKKPGQTHEATGLLKEVREFLQIKGLASVRVINRYDAENLEKDLFDYAIGTVFSEPQVDNISFDVPQGQVVFAVEPLPGQFDQRADSAAQCIQILSQGERPTIRSAKVYVLEGALTEADISAIKKHVINPVECREASLCLPETLAAEYAVPNSVATVTGFIAMDDKGLSDLLDSLGLAMDLDDLKFLQNYFRDEEHRDPTITEIRVVDTYWSDHCRHTTFSTIIDEVKIDDPAVQAAYQRYLAARVEVYGEEKAAKRPQTLMDIATIGAKTLKKRGLLPELDESEEINACSIHVTAKVNGEDQSWVGKRVAGSNDVCCLTCRACRSGLWRNCKDFGEIGFAYDGAYAEYMLAPLYALRALPDNISDIQAAMLELQVVAPEEYAFVTKYLTGGVKVAEEKVEDALSYTYPHAAKPVCYISNLKLSGATMASTIAHEAWHVHQAKNGDAIGEQDARTYETKVLNLLLREQRIWNGTIALYE